jgi:hypothetical protein
MWSPNPKCRSKTPGPHAEILSIMEFPSSSLKEDCNTRENN